MIQNILITLRENKTLQEMLAGMGFVSVVATVLICIFSDKAPYILIGLWTGIAGSIFMVIHMAYTIEDAVELSEKDATNYIRKMTFIRYGVACVLVIAIGITDFGSPVAAVFGLLILKSGAYLQPVIHRFSHGKSENYFTDEENQVIIDKIYSNLSSDANIDSENYHK